MGRHEPGKKGKEAVEGAQARRRDGEGREKVQVGAKWRLGCRCEQGHPGPGEDVLLEPQLGLGVGGGVG